MKLRPYIAEAVWGGQRLAREYGMDPGGKANCAEAWVLSAHPKGSSVVANGAFAGQPLAALVQTHPALFGGAGLPLLIKFIDARQDLSVQVHPREDDAVLRPGEAGKTECWYVLDAQPGAQLLLGFRQATDKAEFARAIRENRLTELTQSFPVKAGDFFFIPAGTLHAIGGGVLLAEVQQSSDTTYRVYDYARLPARELHIEQALAVTDTVPYTQTPAPAKQKEGRKRLVRCPFFAVEVWSPAGGKLEGDVPPDSFVSLVALEGAGRLAACGETLPFQKGESILLPAGSGRFALAGDLDVLCVQV
jgi:mannose-6-phosphate isomerase